MDVKEQCRGCEFQSFNSLCGAGKKRAYQDEKGEFFKSIECTLYRVKIQRSTLISLKVCPTCGQFLPRPEFVYGGEPTVTIISPVNKPAKRRSGNKRARKREA